jgi:hypothetical protein
LRARNEPFATARGVQIRKVDLELWHIITFSVGSAE